MMNKQQPQADILQVENTFPHIKKRVFTMPNTRRWLMIGFALGLLVCAIVNLSTGGKPWALYVLGAEVVAWLAVVNRSLVEYTWMGRATAAFLSVSGYLLLVDFLLGESRTISWSSLVVPIICFSLLIVQATIFFINFKKKRINIMPLYWVCVASLVVIFCALMGWLPMNWPTIVLGSLALALLPASLIAFRKPLLLEIKKRLHV